MPAKVNRCWLVWSTGFFLKGEGQDGRWGEAEEATMKIELDMFNCHGMLTAWSNVPGG
jgi:hypothetical protein